MGEWCIPCHSPGARTGTGKVKPRKNHEMKHPASLDFWDKAVEVVGHLVTATCSIWIVGVVGYQVLTWLRSGGWMPMPTLILFEYLDVSLDAVYSPSSWHGLAKVGQWVLDLPVSITVPGVLVIAYAMLYGAVRKD